MFARWSDLDQVLGTMDLFRTRMNHVFNEFDRSQHAAQGWAGGENFPRTNLCDTGDNLEFVAEVPGISREDLSVKIQGNYLEISGSRKNEVPAGYKMHRSERGARSFSRSFTLPYDINAEQVQATLKDGILRMSLPKSEAAKPRQININ